MNGGHEEILECMEVKDMVYGYVGRALMEEQEDIEKEEKGDAVFYWN